ncbi:LysR family transcriptional regulator [Shewanella sp. SM95]|uniref:LysR family transcriptional regulator n=1 Tax=Shewanella sp. SM95 TaxID=2912812 RepID=UPI0021D8DB0F|nr:LysR family transcriptional regulator [Shewanella sp. SM95]MCU8000653.1 LysR family transcriptional regulator [Shewanella sp. SM95]
MLINDLALFVRVADCGNISAAAAEMDISAASASAAIKRLEKQLDTSLFIRTTRSLRLTVQGERYLIHCRRALSDLALGEQAIASDKGKISGTLSLSVSSDFGRNLFVPWLDEFLLDFPQLQVRLHLGDNISSFYHDKIDVAVRYGKPQDSNQVAFPICSVDRVLCASPEYLATFGVLNSLEQLVEHNCLFYKLDDRTHDQWLFRRDGQEFKVRVTGNRSANDAEIARRWAVAGKGLVFKSSLDLADDLISGRLVRLLPEYKGEPVDLYLVCPGREHVTPVVLLLREMLRQRCKELQMQLAARHILPKHP